MMVVCVFQCSRLFGIEYLNDLLIDLNIYIYINVVLHVLKYKDQKPTFELKRACTFFGGGF